MDSTNADPIVAECLPLARPPATRTFLRCARGGLCNRLRTCLSYALVSAERGGTLEIMWVASNECPGTFTEHFEPLPRCRFIEAPLTSQKESAALWNAQLARLCQESTAVHSQPPLVAVEAHDYHEEVKGHASREALCWGFLRPKPSVLEAVADNKRALPTSGYRAVHIRRTDHGPLAQHRTVAERDFIRFVGGVSEGEGEGMREGDCVGVSEAEGRGKDGGGGAGASGGGDGGAGGGGRADEGEGRDVGEDDAGRGSPFFLATDCAAVRRAWCAREPRRCVVGAHGLNGESGKLRQSSLHASIVDLFTCVEARAFKGSTCSSFSDAIGRLRMVRGTSAAADEHEYCDPPPPEL